MGLPFIRHSTFNFERKISLFLSLEMPPSKITKPANILMAIKRHTYTRARAHARNSILSNDGTMKLLNEITQNDVYLHNAKVIERTHISYNKQLKFIGFILERISSRTTRSPECFGIRSLVNCFSPFIIESMLKLPSV